MSDRARVRFAAMDAASAKFAADQGPFWVERQRIGGAEGWNWFLMATRHLVADLKAAWDAATDVYAATPPEGGWCSGWDEWFSAPCGNGRCIGDLCVTHWRAARRGSA